MANMTQAQNNMSQTIAQSIAAALAAHGTSPQEGHHPVAAPQPSDGTGSGLRMNLAFTYSTDSTKPLLWFLNINSSSSSSFRLKMIMHTILFFI
ncbi:hypothetical protein SLE2022_014950 [Rubroshorea leprosula]